MLKIFSIHHDMSLNLIKKRNNLCEKWPLMENCQHSWSVLLVCWNFPWYSFQKWENVYLTVFYSLLLYWSIFLSPFSSIARPKKTKTPLYKQEWESFENTSMIFHISIDNITNITNILEISFFFFALNQLSDP